MISKTRIILLSINFNLFFYEIKFKQIKINENKIPIQTKIK